ncbi:MAG TPA: hypothetical protein VGB70_03970 [Allosphingosinicella sp.]|jgi:hypothetical protein
MNRKKKIILGAGGGIALLAAAGTAFAVNADCSGRNRADLNKDGQVSAAEIEQSGKQMFARFDANKDGKLAGAELPRGHDSRLGGRAHGERDGEARLYRVVQPAAPPAAGQPGAAPAQQVMLAPVRGERPSPDANGDGAVDLAEFVADHRQRLTRADSNGDGALSAEELAARPHHGRRG